ncbi:DNA-binding response regulator [Sporosarcina sp. P13]|uniref:response regulator transcription factor n=1 Tax=Sporosarcina sp. P13 TaxID=2048263 RepID=UPI000C165856|nr:response regulator transcription factor [Sporosarcina sp. P13]PIC63545.1 DNA-binding response regulator [Sporosarcina sp. P13]
MIRIVIAEDQRMMLGALGSLLNLEEDMEVVGMAKNGQEAVDLVKSLAPDICIMDIEMPIKTGLDAAEELQDLDCQIIILTTFARAGYFERARNAGVKGYLLKDNPIEELVRSIHSIIKGGRIYAPELIDLAFDMKEEKKNPLTEREAEVLKLVSEGKTTKQIAAELFLSPGTVRNYVSTILDKLGVRNRIEAISMFQEKGWFK